jgi:hypothetical protein
MRLGFEPRSKRPNFHILSLWRDLPLSHMFDLSLEKNAKMKKIEKKEKTCKDKEFAINIKLHVLLFSFLVLLIFIIMFLMF